MKHFTVLCPVDGKPAPWVENKAKYGRNYGKSYMCYYCAEHEGASNWESVCKYLETRYNGQIEEITVLVIN